MCVAKATHDIWTPKLSQQVPPFATQRLTRLCSHHHHLFKLIPLFFHLKKKSSAKTCKSFVARIKSEMEEEEEQDAGGVTVVLEPCIKLQKLKLYTCGIYTYNNLNIRTQLYLELAHGIGTLTKQAALKAERDNSCYASTIDFNSNEEKVEHFSAISFLIFRIQFLRFHFGYPLKFH
ncbi:unnamed protein product [Ceratitis capitata]|uniref:(Mediterranean fruit fly) hypothetical protein n=1 Tax=Ceratitis capitata TaxID=7213 RepID=A0A811VFZ5_CERCA|nr:unnamed protein product [Ceratitis capitata]